MGVWIETAIFALCARRLVSHPVWVCGLKLRVPGTIKRDARSHPVWVCGLKRNNQSARVHLSPVTPCMGVWIET